MNNAVDAVFGAVFNHLASGFMQYPKEFFAESKLVLTTTEIFCKVLDFSKIPYRMRVSKKQTIFGIQLELPIFMIDMCSSLNTVCSFRLDPFAGLYTKDIEGLVQGSFISPLYVQGSLRTMRFEDLVWEATSKASRFLPKMFKDCKEAITWTTGIYSVTEHAMQAYLESDMKQARTLCIEALQRQFIPKNGDNIEDLVPTNGYGLGVFCSYALILAFYRRFAANSRDERMYHRTPELLRSRILDIMISDCCLDYLREYEGEVQRGVQKDAISDRENQCEGILCIAMLESSEFKLTPEIMNPDIVREFISFATDHMQTDF